MFTATKRRLGVTGVVLALSVLLLAAARGPKPPVNTGDSGSVAIQGYDVVAYASGVALKGDPRFEHRWNGAAFHFAKAENRDRFAKEPDRYAPQFGGYCAYAVSRGYTADVDPEAFTIVDGRLYLNYSKSVKRRWEQDIPGNISKAQANWPAVLRR